MQGVGVRSAAGHPELKTWTRFPVRPHILIMSKNQLNLNSDRHRNAFANKGEDVSDLSGNAFKVAW